MQICKNVFQLTGHVTGLNANTYAIDTSGGIVLIDAGYQPCYVETMKRQMELWGLDFSRICAVFLTHAHFDHAGNAHMFEEMGIPVHASETDARSVETGGPLVMEDVFGSVFTPCRQVVRLADGEKRRFGEVTIEAIDLAGHTAGAMGFLAHTPAGRILFTGDMFIISGTSPSDEIELEIGFTGGADYDAAANLRSFQKLPAIGADIAAGGHRGIYYGDCRELFEKLRALAEKEIQV